MPVTRSIVPNLFTLMNLFSGFAAIVYTSDGKFTTAAIFIFIAAVFDALDGVMARLFKASSEFGAELDSLCDAVSFGVAPAYMLYALYFHTLGEIGILLASLPALAGVVRLARFNVHNISFDDKNYFTGMPIPSSALTIISYVVFVHGQGYYPLSWELYIVTGLSLMTSLSMVSSVKFDNIPRPTKKSIKQRPIVSVIFIGGFILNIATSGKYIFPLMLFYILTSSLRHFIKWLRASPEAADDIDESEIEEN